MATSSPLYQIDNLRFRYSLGKQMVHALQGVSLTIDKGSFACLTGPSGSGKTTLLSILGLIEFVQEGRVVFEAKDIATLKEKERNQLRRFRIGFVFQQFHLLPVLSARENVEFFLSRQGLDAKTRADRVRESLEAVGLWEQRDQRPLEMSGGQRQRVAIARAMAKKPDVLIADEPTANLDQMTGKGIMKILTEWNEHQRVTLIVASHDMMVQSFAKTNVKLQDGQIVASS